MVDSELIETFVERGDGAQAAFAELVRRHVNWVYSTARRLVNDAHLADDVTQAVFVVLAKKAGKVKQSGSISPWLFQVVQYVSRGALKMQRRRKFHEGKAAEMKAYETIEEVNWGELSEMLDGAVGKLREIDRRAVLLRFYEQKSFAQVAVEMGTSEDAARKRVS